MISASVSCGGSATIAYTVVDPAGISASVGCGDAGTLSVSGVGCGSDVTGAVLYACLSTNGPAIDIDATAAPSSVAATSLPSEWQLVAYGGSTAMYTGTDGFNGTVSRAEAGCVDVKVSCCSGGSCFHLRTYVVKVEIKPVAPDTAFDYVCTNSPHSSHQVFIDVTPDSLGSAAVKLSLNRTTGLTGGALFSGPNTTTTNLSGDTTLTIMGTETSDEPGNMTLAVTIGDCTESCASAPFTVMDIQELAATELLHTTNHTEATPTSSGSLYVCESTNGTATLSLGAIWAPDGTDADFVRWQIRTAAGGTPTEWDASSGNFSSEPVTNTWRTPTNNSSPTREFKVTAWYDCDRDTNFNTTAVEPNCVITNLTVCDVDKLTVVDASDSGNTVSDSTDADDTNSPTLYIDQSTTSSVAIVQSLSWLPAGVPGDRFRWQIDKTSGETGASGWAATDGSFGVGSATNVWTESVTNHCRRYDVRAYYDCNQNKSYDADEPHRMVHVVVVKISLDNIEDLCDKDVKKGTQCDVTNHVQFAPSPIGKEFSIEIKNKVSGARGKAEYDDATVSKTVAADAVSPQGFVLQGTEGNTNDNDMLWQVTFNNRCSVSDEFTVVEITEIENEGVDPIPPQEGVTSTNTVTVYPSSRTVKWEWLTNSVNYGCVWDTSEGTTGIIKMSSTNDFDSDGGSTIEEPVVQFRAYIDGDVSNCCYVAAKISVKCPCGCGGATTFAAVGVGGANGSGNVLFGTYMGVGIDGRSMGELYVNEELPYARLSTPACLKFHTVGQGVEVFRDLSGIRQIKVPQLLVDVVVSNEFRYQLDFYKLSAITGACATGWYLLDGAAYRTCVVENPDGSNACNRLLWIEQSGLRASTNLFVHSEAERKWSLWEGTGLRLKTVAITTNAVGDSIQTWSTMDARSNVVAQTSRRMHRFAWGQEVVETAIDPNGANLSTKVVYCEDPSRPLMYGRVEFVVKPDGGWNRFEYGTTGLKSAVFSPWCDAPTNAGPTQCNATYLDYTPLDPADVPERLDVRPRTVTITALGQVVSRTFQVYATNALGAQIRITERAQSPTAAYGDTNNLRTTQLYYGPYESEELVGRLACTINPDCKRDGYFYERGTFVTNAGPAQSTFVAGAGDFIRTTVTHGTLDHTNGIPFQTTRDVAIVDSLDQSVQEETYVCTDTGFARIDWTVYCLDDMGNPVCQYRSDGTVEEGRWACCGKEWERTGSGEERTFLYDALKRRDMIVQHAATNIVTSYSFDAAGRTIAEQTRAGDLCQVSSNGYDSAGHLTSHLDRTGLLTTYDVAQGGRIRTSVAPGNATNITETFRDGRPKAVSGNAATPTCYGYGVNPDGSQWTIVYTGTDGTNSRAWRKTTTDMLGRTTQEERPAFGGGVLTNRSFYNARGKLVQRTEPGRAATLHAYDEVGSQTLTALDVDGDSQIDLAGPDRVTELRAYYELIAGNWHRSSASILYPKTGSASPVTNSVTRIRLTGLGGVDAELGALKSETVSYDIRGNATVSRSYVDRTARTSTSIVVAPDSTNAARNISVNGQTAVSISKTGVRTEYDYDALGRQVEVRTPSDNGRRMVGSRTHYDPQGRVDWTEDLAGNRTSYIYDTAGRRICITDALSNTTHTAYDQQGRVIGTWGATYPVAYDYDEQGRMTAMYTYRGTNGILTYADLSSLKTHMDRTAWQYDAVTGLLTNKLYADGKGTGYTYWPDGKLATRTWARGITTTYRYDTCCGALTNVDYSDATPDVSYTYERMGRQVTVTDGHGGRAFTYDDLMQLRAETDVCGVLERVYDSHGRNAGLSAGPNYSVSYGYDKVGRLGMVSSLVHSVTSVANYTYEPGSGLLSGYTLGGLAVAKVYELNRDLITAVSNRWGGAPVSVFDYKNDEVGRRTVRIDTLATTNTFHYNTCNEMNAAVMGTNSYGFVYDGIGNRVMCTENAETTRYKANELNQYTNIANGAADEPTYDADGNMLTQNGWHLVWDAENRLIALSKGTTTVTCAYDYMGRRYQKVVNGATNAFVYDGWAVIQEQSAKATNRYVYGIDLSRTMQGSGTIGGVLSGDLNGTMVFYFCDANGNVTDLVDTNGGGLARYEYDAYGNVTHSAGTAAAANPWRFSTKPFDVEAGFGYWGHRYYSPTQGRWLSRDPIREVGFGRSFELQLTSLLSFDNLDANAYEYSHNNAIGRHDVIGLAESVREGLACKVCHDVQQGAVFHSGVEFTTALFPVKTQRHVELKLSIEFKQVDHGGTRLPCDMNYRRVIFRWWTCTWGYSDRGDGDLRAGWRESETATITSDIDDLRDNSNVYFEGQVDYFACEAQSGSYHGTWKKRRSTSAKARYVQNVQDATGTVIGWQLENGSQSGGESERP